MVAVCLVVALLAWQTLLAAEPPSPDEVAPALDRSTYFESLNKGAKEYEQTFDNEWRLSDGLRFSAGGYANPEECQTVVDFALETSRGGRQCIDTHRVYGKNSPYTPRESVFTVRAYHAVRLANENTEVAEQVWMFLRLAERVRQQVIARFNLTSPLYYHLTEIMCRKPRVFDSVQDCVDFACIPFEVRSCPDRCLDVERNEIDQACNSSCHSEARERCREICTADDWLSHPIHADANPFDCDMLESGVCLRRLPRDFTAHMYLNENFVGGDFFFTQDPTGKKVEKLVQPTCGRILGYTSGYENMHGVTALKEGERCHITLWFSQDERKIEELPLPADSPFVAGRRIGPGRDMDRKRPN